MYFIIGLVLGLLIGTFSGMIICALLTANKIHEVYEENTILRKENYKLNRMV